MTEAYDGQQVVGIDPHRRRSVLVQMTKTAASWRPSGSKTRRRRCGRCWGQTK
jgi:hypothetical protein